MQFQDDLAAGIVLIRPALRSPNYQAGVSGWTINQDGSSEFNNVTIRSTLQSSNYVAGVSGWQLLNTGHAEFSDITLRGSKIIKGGMIDDGAVTTPTLGTGAVTATALGTGAVTGPKLATGAVGYQALAVGTGNLVPDPGFEGAYAQTLATGSWAIDTTGNNSGHSIRVTAGGAFPTKTLTTIQVIPGEKHYLAVDYKTSPDWAGTGINIHLAFKDASGASVGTAVCGDNPVPGATWKRISGLFTVPANAVTADVNLQQAGATTAGQTWWDNAEIRTALVAGAVSAGIITTGMLAAGSVTADRLDANAINGKTITGATLIGSNQYLYNGTPGVGNLLMSVVGTAGTDPFGNAVQAGLTVYGTNGTINLADSDTITTWQSTSGSAIILGVGAGSALQQFVPPSVAGVTWQFGTLGATVGSTLGANTPVVTLSSGYNQLHPSTASIQLFGGNSDNAANRVDISTQQLTVTSSIVKLGETWQTPSPLGTGWATGPSAGTVQPIQYRRDAEDNLIITGAIHTTSTTPAATVFTLPLAYRPKITQRVPGVSNSGGTATERYVEINSNGNVTVNANLTTASTDVYFQVCVPLGSIA